ncbi:hypothetical protein BV898_03764 [Hypsibius exemplaris]|uniref:Uncharacterized protein n=1 Tax=Hypsibius exemplaris TaxID=2072580 RepID=A0A1W0X4B2_HYPEX|nr:hypothetical protein BV898_03764 [Hypsibius exemplaris]
MALADVLALRKDDTLLSARTSAKAISLSYRTAEFFSFVPFTICGTTIFSSEMSRGSGAAALRKDDTLLETCKAAMDSGARESLQNARKAISKSVFMSVTKLEELDETLPRF